MPIPEMTNMLREGMRAAIACQILEGDLPVTFRWERNGQPVVQAAYGGSVPSGGATVTRLDEFSTRLVIDHIASTHSGNYTCVASNVAGTERFTVPLTVNGKCIIFCARFHSLPLLLKISHLICDPTTF